MLKNDLPRTSPPEDSEPASERRELPRYPIPIEGRLTTSEGADQACVIRDFSATGMYVFCESDTFRLLPGADRQLRAGDVVEIRFQLPDHAGRVRVRAIAKRIERSPFADGIGIHYATCNSTILQALIRESKRVASRLGAA